MIDSLTNVISHFPGAANRARCTAHIVNLVSKIILQQFDARKKTKGPKKKSVKVDNEVNDTIMDDEPTNSAEPVVYPPPECLESRWNPGGW